MKNIFITEGLIDVFYYYKYFWYVHTSQQKENELCMRKCLNNFLSMLDEEISSRFLHLPHTQSDLKPYRLL